MSTARAAVLIAAVGLAVGLIWAVTGLLDQVQRPAQFSRAALPGGVQVVLTQPGRHVVYHEAPGGSPTLTADQVEVRAPDGALLPVQPYRADLRYDRADALGAAIGLFTATRTGTYLVSSPDRTGAGGSIAVGDDLAPDVARAVALPALTAMGALILAALIALSPSFARQRTPIA
jgi:hypothetical protein